MSWADCDFAGSGQEAEDGSHFSCVKMVGHIGEPHVDCRGIEWWTPDLRRTIKESEGRNG